MAELSDAGWETLRRELSERLAVFAPDWTDFTESDPGITFVEIFGFLTEQLLYRDDLSSPARTRLLEILERFERVGISDCDDSALARPRFYAGKFLTAEDFDQEQSYHRTKHRRHNRLLHGLGIVRGLGVRLEPRPDGDDETVVVSPGVAISPEGDELVLCEPVTRDVRQDGSACYVTLALAERPADPTPEGDHSRIEESAEVAVSEDVPRGHLAIARLLNEGGAWRSDATFNPRRVQ